MRIVLVANDLPAAQYDTFMCNAPAAIHLTHTDREELQRAKNALVKMIVDSVNDPVRHTGTATVVMSEVAGEYPGFDIAIFGDYQPALGDIQMRLQDGDISPDVRVHLLVHDDCDCGALTDPYYDFADVNPGDKFNLRVKCSEEMYEILRTVEKWCHGDYGDMPNSELAPYELFEGVLGLYGLTYDDRFNSNVFEKPGVEKPALVILEMLCSVCSVRLSEVSNNDPYGISVTVDFSDVIGLCGRRDILPIFMDMDEILYDMKLQGGDVSTSAWDDVVFRMAGMFSDNVDN